MNKKIYRSFINSSDLFTSPSFLKGSSRIVDLFGYLDDYNYKSTDNQVDSEALKRDWEIVGLDILDAIKLYEQSHAT